MGQQGSKVNPVGHLIAEKYAEEILHYVFIIGFWASFLTYWNQKQF